MQNVQPAAPAHPGQPPSFNALLGTPVHISDDPTWPTDHWAVVQDGVVTAQGYGNPVQPQIGA